MKYQLVALPRNTTADSVSPARIHYVPSKGEGSHFYGIPETSEVKCIGEVIGDKIYLMELYNDLPFAVVHFKAHCH